APGETKSVQFGNYQNASVSGIKFNDVNGDGTQAATGEPGLSGWTIHLFGTNTKDGSVHQHTTTGTGGAYSFTGLTPGTYTICESLQAGWVQTLPTGPVDCSTHAAGPDPGIPAASGKGYSFTLTSGQQVPSPPDTPPNFGNRQLFRLIVVTCNDVSNTLVGSAVTLSNNPNTTTISTPPGTLTQQQLCDETANPAGIANGGATYGGLTPGPPPPNVTIPPPHTTAP